jgi:hypothetical protein
MQLTGSAAVQDFRRPASARYTDIITCQNAFLPGQA